MTVNWTSEDAGFHTAECVLEAGHVMYLLAESLGEHGWDWQAWDPTERYRTCYGTVDTLEAAKVQAELALMGSAQYRRRAA